MQHFFAAICQLLNSHQLNFLLPSRELLVDNNEIFLPNNALHASLFSEAYSRLC